MTRRPFFVGWAAGSARPIAGFLVAWVLVLLAGAGGLALALGSRVDDPGNGEFLGDRVYTGVLVEHPYPLLVVPPDAEHPAGHAVVMSGGGKRGVQPEAAGLGGRLVRASGTLVHRGDVDMLLVEQLKAVEGAAASVEPVDLGRWRVVGEICDGKCVSGVMRPGQGLSHKACANVCLLGGVPPILVTTQPVAGSIFLLMGDPDGRALPDAFRDHVGVPRRMDGTVQRIGDLLVFRTDVTKAIVP